jgi:septum formation protein
MLHFSVRQPFKISGCCSKRKEKNLFLSPGLSCSALNVLSLANSPEIPCNSNYAAFSRPFNHLTISTCHQSFDTDFKTGNIFLRFSKKCETKNLKHEMMLSKPTVPLICRFLPVSCNNRYMLVLASSSPRRRELLTQAGFTFNVRPACIPECVKPGEDPTAYVIRLARQKAQFIFHQLTQESFRSSEGSALYQGAASVVPQEPSAALQVLGADTIVTLDGQILGKPADAADAARMLRLLSGRTHHVITGVALVATGSIQAVAEVTTVEFLSLSEKQIAAYVATGEPMDKAGAYAIQGRAARWIPRIEGDYSNVVGLPLALVSSMLESSLPYSESSE